jgi:hypothetical protein
MQGRFQGSSLVFNYSSTQFTTLRQLAPSDHQS